MHVESVREANRLLATLPLTVETEAGAVLANPLLRLRRQESERVHALASELGLSPASRSRVEVMPEAEGEDPWAGILDL